MTCLVAASATTCGNTQSKVSSARREIKPNQTRPDQTIFYPTFELLASVKATLQRALLSITSFSFFFCSFVSFRFFCSFCFFYFKWKTFCSFIARLECSFSGSALVVVHDLLIAPLMMIIISREGERYYNDLYG